MKHKSWELSLIICFLLKHPFCEVPNLSRIYKDWCSESSRRFWGLREEHLWFHADVILHMERDSLVWNPQPLIAPPCQSPLTLETRHNKFGKINWPVWAQFFPSWEKNLPAENMCSFLLSSMKQKWFAFRREVWDHSAESVIAWVHLLKSVVHYK